MNNKQAQAFKKEVMTAVGAFINQEFDGSRSDGTAHVTVIEGSTIALIVVNTADNPDRRVFRVSVAEVKGSLYP